MREDHPGAPPRRTAPGQIWATTAAALAAIAVAVVVGWRVGATFAAAPTDFDDAYTFLRYARNWLAGHGLAWNPGDFPSWGATSLPHVALVALTEVAMPGLEDGRLLQVASAGAGVALALALGVATARIAAAAGVGVVERWLAGALAALAVATSEPFAFHLGSGMDTMLAALANTGLGFAALVLAARPSGARAIACALAAAGAVLVRPDSAVYALGVPVLALALLAPLSGRRRALVAFTLTFGALVAGGAALAWWRLGTPVPLAFFAKRAFAYAGFAGEYTWNPLLFLRVFLVAALPFVAAIALFAHRDDGRLVAALLAPVAVTFGVLFAFNQIMGHLGRFHYPALPFFVLAAARIFARRRATPAVGVATAGAAPASRAPEQVAGGYARGLAVRAGALVFAALVGDRLIDRAAARYERRAEHQTLADLGGYATSSGRVLPILDSWRASHEMAALAHRAPAGTILAMSEHGLVGARAPHVEIVDVLGLHDPGFARHGFSVEALWRRAPDVLWMPHWDHTRMIREILDSGGFWRHYRFFPDAYTYGVALRTDSPRHQALRALFESGWRRLYPGLVPDEYVARRASSGGGPAHLTAGRHP